MTEDHYAGWEPRLQRRINSINHELGTALRLDANAQGVFVVDDETGTILSGNGTRGRTPRVLDDWLVFTQRVLQCGMRAEAAREQSARVARVMNEGRR